MVHLTRTYTLPAQGYDMIITRVLAARVYASEMLRPADDKYKLAMLV